MTSLDPPATAARRQWVIDRMTEDLVEWGCPLDAADHRARQLLDHALDAGYALPAALQPAPRHGPGSTKEGRRAARAAYEAARAQARAGSRPRAGQDQDASGIPVQPPNHPGAAHGER